MEKIDYCPLETVNERITHYTKLVEQAKPNQHVNNALLLFWMGYKAEHYPNT
jgi:hypothetical protein